MSTSHGGAGPYGYFDEALLRQLLEKHGGQIDATAAGLVLKQCCRQVGKIAKSARVEMDPSLGVRRAGKLWLTYFGVVAVFWERVRRRHDAGVTRLRRRP